MNRLITDIFWALILLVFVGSCQQQIRETPPPNIIFIMADDLGYADLGVYGQKIIQTPKY